MTTILLATILGLLLISYALRAAWRGLVRFGQALEIMEDLNRE